MIEAAETSGKLKKDGTIIEPTSGNTGIGMEMCIRDRLGAAPCTAMVFVWSYLTKGDAAYTLVQVAVNDLLILVAFAPIVAFLLGVGGIIIPWDTLTLSAVSYTHLVEVKAWRSHRTMQIGGS